MVSSHSRKDEGCPWCPFGKGANGIHDLPKASPASIITMGVRFLMYGFWGDPDIHSVPCRLELFLPYLIKSLSQLCLLRSYECFPRSASLRSQRNWQLSLLHANSELTCNSAVPQSNLFSSLTSCSCLTVDVQTTRTRAIELHRK